MRCTISSPIGCSSHRTPRLAFCLSRAGQGSRELPTPTTRRWGGHLASPASSPGPTRPRPRGRCRKAPTHIECTMRKAVAEALIGVASDLKHDYPRRATNGSMRGLPALTRGLHMSGEPPSAKISTLPPNKATPRHLTKVGTHNPCASIQSMHSHALHHYTTHNIAPPYTPYYLGTTSSLDLHEHAPHVPIMMYLGNPHNTAAHTIKQKGCGAHQAATTFPNEEGTKDTPPPPPLYDIYEAESTHNPYPHQCTRA